MDIAILNAIIDILIASGAVAAAGFAITEIAGYFNTRSANNSIVQTSTTAINSIVAMTGVHVNAQQAMTIAEISGIPTQLVTPKDKVTVS